MCAAGSDDGSVCWAACCTPLLQGGGAIAAEQSSVFYGTNGRKYTGSIVRTGSTFRNSTSGRRAAPPPPARTPNRAAEVAHEGETCLEQCLGGAGVCPQYCGRQGACCRADDHVDSFLRGGQGAISAPAGRRLPAACRADVGTRLGCVGAHCCTLSATPVPALELDNEGESCWSHCSERAGGCSGFCGSDGACCRRGESGHADGVACNHGAVGCASEHCCVHNAVKVRELQHP